MHDLALASVSYIILYHIYTIPQHPTVESAYNAGDPGLIPGSGDPLEKEMATHSSMENRTDRGT